MATVINGTTPKVSAEILSYNGGTSSCSCTWIKSFTSEDDLFAYASSSTSISGQMLIFLGSPNILYQVEEDKSVSVLAAPQIIVTITESPQVINHGLNKYPNVVVVDSNLNEVECNVQYEDLYNIIVSWNGDLTGKIIIN